MVQRKGSVCLQKEICVRGTESACRKELKKLRERTEKSWRNWERGQMRAHTRKRSIESCAQKEFIDSHVWEFLGRARDVFTNAARVKSARVRSWDLHEWENLVWVWGIETRTRVFKGSKACRFFRDCSNEWKFWSNKSFNRSTDGSWSKDATKDRSTVGDDRTRWMWRRIDQRRSTDRVRSIEGSHDEGQSTQRKTMMINKMTTTGARGVPELYDVLSPDQSKKTIETTGARGVPEHYDRSKQELYNVVTLIPSWKWRRGILRCSAKCLHPQEERSTLLLMVTAQRTKPMVTNIYRGFYTIYI